MERLVLVVGAAVFIDTMFYAVIAPLLPALSHQLHLSKLSAGVLTASYPAGMLIGSFPGSALSVRWGPRFTVCVGLALLAVSTVAFGWLKSAWSLDLARLLEGLGGACSWAGGLAWVVAASRHDQRGSVIGKALAAAIGGGLFGPVIGAVASGAGRGLVFTVLALSALLLITVVRTVPDEVEASEQGVLEVVRKLGRPAMLRGLWLMTLPATVSGALSLFGPLQLHHLGAGAGTIGAIFLVASAFEAAISPSVGRISDRYGRLLPMRVGLALLAAALACFTLPGTWLVLGLLMIGTFVVLGCFWTPAMALLSDVSHDQGIDQAHGAALMNLAWAVGQIIGSAAGGGAAKAFGDAVPTLVVAGTCVLTLVVLSRRDSTVVAGEPPREQLI
jgi:DHA1 family multidrug resistance protein-like MFS transporter